MGQSSGPQYVFTLWTGTLNILYDEKFRLKISPSGTNVYDIHVLIYYRDEIGYPIIDFRFSRIVPTASGMLVGIIAGSLSASAIIPLLFYGMHQSCSYTTIFLIWAGN